MRSILISINRVLGLGVLALLLASCGGGGGGDDDGGFTGPSRLRVTVTASPALLPPNPNFIPFPNPGDGFTSIITVRAEIDGQPIADGTPVQLAITQGLELGALVCPEISDICTEFDQPDQPPNVADFQQRFRSFGGDDVLTTSGVFTFFYVSEGGANGVATVAATVTDPSTNENVRGTVDIRIGAGVSTGLPASVDFAFSDAPLYIRGQGRPDSKLIQLFVGDDAGAPVPNPTGRNVRLELLPGRPNGGERLVARDSAGTVEEGVVVNTSTINGRAEASLQAGTLPGTITLAGIADRADNDVSNGIQTPVVDIIAIPVGSGEIVSLNFTGPYPGAVASRANTLDLGVGDFLDANNGVYSRLITVLAADQFGNPPPPGQPITFRLVDSPASGYPTEGRGVFDIGADDGNPEEGGFTFSTQTSSLVGTRSNCILMFGGIPPEFNDSPVLVRREFRPDQEGSRIITNVSGNNLLSVNTAFNLLSAGLGQPIDTGFDVPYVVGCAPHFGNVQNNPGSSPEGTNVLTNNDGFVSTIMNYPRTQLGRHFCLAAEANGGKAGALLCHWYLGIATGAVLNTIPNEDAERQFTVLVGQKDLATCPTCTKRLTLQLFDGGTPPSPLPAERIAVSIVITDPDRTAAIIAEGNVRVAEARLAAALASLAGAGCSEQPPEEDVVEPEVCAPLRAAVLTARTDLAAAREALAAAQAQDALYSPSATVTPEPAITDANGIVTLTLTVLDLPPNGLVEFFISTVGPEILAPTITVTANPSAPGEPPQ